MKSETGILKWPLIVAAVVVVLRVVFERLGVPESVNNVLSIAVMHTLIVPLYIGWQLGRRKSERPFLTLLKLVALYAVLTRIMILPTYWAARIFQWTNNRFGGLWGDGIDPIRGFVAVPLGTAAIWIVASIVVGGVLGSVALAVTRKVSHGSPA
jgi:hypothetical protein